jgi:hypothetical protein
MVSTRRGFITFTVAGALLLGLVPPAAAQSEAVQEKSVKGTRGRSGMAIRYADRSGEPTVNSVTLTATDADGGGGRCTETWVDYRTKPHQHFNPGLLVNCSGGTRRVAGAVANDYEGVVGMSIVVCEVPDTSGAITRDDSNCRGALSAMSLHSGHRYDQFRVHAAQQPSGVQIWVA